MAIQSVCVFCGANDGLSETIQVSARQLGARLAQSHMNLVFGGGKVGLMGMVADAVLANQGQVLGVIPEALVTGEVAHRECTELVIVQTMHERKALMADRSEAFIALPGGFGTLDELNEIITWKQIGYHNKPIVILNIDGYYDSFLSFVDHAIGKGLIKSHHRELFEIFDDVEQCISYLKSL